jgi:hypothetical protein
MKEVFPLISPGNTALLAILSLAAVLAAALTGAPEWASAAMHGHQGGPDQMTMHHMHVLLNHGLVMALQGSDAGVYLIECQSLLGSNCGCLRSPERCRSSDSTDTCAEKHMEEKRREPGAVIWY